MLESLATDILNNYLGKYIENVSQDKLRIQMWKGMGVLHEPRAISLAGPKS